MWCVLDWLSFCSNYSLSAGNPVGCTKRDRISAHTKVHCALAFHYARQQRYVLLFGCEWLTGAMPPLEKWAARAFSTGLSCKFNSRPSCDGVIPRTSKTLSPKIIYIYIILLMQTRVLEFLGICYLQFAHSYSRNSAECLLTCSFQHACPGTRFIASQHGADESPEGA